LKSIPFFPRKLASAKESRKADTEGRVDIEVIEAIEVLLEMIGDSDENVFGKRESLPRGLIV
jgi:hypothetical protein